MSSVLDAFPSRPLTLKPGRNTLGRLLWGLVGLLLFGGFLVMVLYDVVPAIQTDFELKGAAVQVADAEVKGTCRARMGLFQDCNLTLSRPNQSPPLERHVNLLFVAPHLGSWEVTVLADPARPDLLTADLGLERLTNRVATAIGAVIAALLLLAGMFLLIRQTLRDGRALKTLSGQALRPIPVLFRGWGQGPSWIVQDEHGRTYEWPVRKSDAPFVLDAERGLVLALTDPTGTVAFPLDEKLRFVQLDEVERTRIHAARPVGSSNGY